MKTIKELQEASLVELAANEKEWKIRTLPTINNWFRMIIFREQVKELPEYIRICNRFQWMLAKLAAWAKRQRPCKLWAIGSGIVTGISFAAILIMTIAGVPLADQIWAIVSWAISAFIFLLYQPLNYSDYGNRFEQMPNIRRFHRGCNKYPRRKRK